ncbi:MAG: cation:proton antiporter [Alphaproteobacteria bacterium]
MHDISYLNDIITLLVASIVVVVIFRQIGLSPALGYLIAGAIIGPFGMQYVQSTQSTKSIAELGIVFMLFAIGLELTFARLSTIRKYVFGFGTLQIFLTSSVIIYICYFFFKIPIEGAIIISCALAMSSTAIVMQVIAENGEQSTRVGRLSFSILLMQDLAVIPILVLLPLLSKANLNVFNALGGALFNAIIALLIIFAVGSLLLKPFFRIIAHTQNEVLFLSFTLLIVLGSALLCHKLGLSFALGAFIAGLMVAETEYRYRVEEEILSLKSLLMGLFFMTIGMSFDTNLLLDALLQIIEITLGLIALKASIIIILCRIFRFPLAPAIHTGLLLSQGGEFSFVVLLVAVQEKLIDDQLSQILMTAITFSMALTPMLANIGRKIKGQIYIKEILRDNKLKREIGDISKHVIIIGFSKVSRIIAYILRKRKINYLILENNHRVVRIEKNNGFNIYYGDPMNIEILNYIGTPKAESVIIGLDDEIACIKITRFIHQNFPTVAVITKSETFNNADRFKKVGASYVVSKNLETGLQLSQAALARAGLKTTEINDIINSFRNINNEALKDLILFDENEELEKARNIENKQSKIANPDEFNEN